jgi:hypothetical protein
VTANFCSNCGSPLHLQDCPSCEAINNRTAVACVKCGHVLPNTIGSAPGANVGLAAGAADGAMGHGVSALESDTRHFKDLLARLESEVDQQLGANRRPASSALPERDPLPAYTAHEGGHDPPSDLAIERDPALGQPPVACTPAIQDAQPLACFAASHQPGPQAYVERTDEGDTISPLPKHRSSAAGRSEWLAGAALLMLLAAGGYAYHGYDPIPSTRTPLTHEPAGESRATPAARPPQEQPAPAANPGPHGQNANAPARAQADSRAAPPAGSESTNSVAPSVLESDIAGTSTDRGTAAAAQDEQAAAPSPPAGCPAAAQTLEPCSNRGKK